MPPHTEAPNWRPHTATGAHRKVRSPGDASYLCPDPFPEMAPTGGRTGEGRWIPSCQKEAASLDPLVRKRNRISPR